MINLNRECRLTRISTIRIKFKLRQLWFT